MQQRVGFFAMPVFKAVKISIFLVQIVCKKDCWKGIHLRGHFYDVIYRKNAKAPKAKKFTAIMLWMDEKQRFEKVKFCIFAYNSRG